MTSEYFGWLPPVLVRKICCCLDLDDIVNLQRAHPSVELIIDNVFFDHMKEMKVNWKVDVIVLTFATPSTSMEYRTTASTMSSNLKHIVLKTKGISKLSVTKVEDAMDFPILDVLVQVGIRLVDLEIILRPGQSGDNDFVKHKIYRKLIDFVRECGQSLTRLRLETDPWNSVEYQLSDSDAKAVSACLIYAHDNDAILQQLLIIPMFHVMNEDRLCPSTMTLRIGWREKPAMALQAAFHIAMTRHQRSQVQMLILDFGCNISTLSYEEIQELLLLYAPYLNDTRQLRHLVLDMRHSTLRLSNLEVLYKIVSRELPDPHRISLYTSERLPKAPIIRLRKHRNRIACA